MMKKVRFTMIARFLLLAALGFLFVEFTSAQIPPNNRKPEPAPVVHPSPVTNHHPTNVHPTPAPNHPAPVMNHPTNAHPAPAPNHMNHAHPAPAANPPGNVHRAQSPGPAPVKPAPLPPKKPTLWNRVTSLFW